MHNRATTWLHRGVAALACLLFGFLIWASLPPPDEPPQAPELPTVVGAQRPPERTPAPATEVRATPENQPLQMETGEAGSVTAHKTEHGVEAVVVVPTTSLTGGQIITVEVTLSNRGAMELGLIQPQLYLKGALGAYEDDWAGLNLHESGTPEPKFLNPGERVEYLLPVYVPHSSVDSSTKSAVWAVIWFQIPDSQEPFLGLEVGPIPVKVSAPQPEQEVTAQIDADQRGWTVTALNPPPDGRRRYQGLIEFETDRGWFLESLPLTTTGTWSDRDWHGPPVKRLRAFVTSTGRTGTVVTQPVTITAAERRDTYDQRSPVMQVPSLEAAEAILGLSLLRPSSLPPESTLESVTLVTFPMSAVELRYRLPSGAVLAVSQVERLDNHPFQQSVNELDIEERITIGGQAGYAYQRLGDWYLEYRSGSLDVTISAPDAALPLRSLIEIAESMK